MEHRREYEVVIVDIEGELYTWVEGIFTGGSQKSLNIIKAYATLGEAEVESSKISIAHDTEPILPSSLTPEGAIAAITHLSPGRAIIRKAPKSVLNYIDSLKERHSMTYDERDEEHVNNEDEERMQDN